MAETVTTCEQLAPRQDEEEEAVVGTRPVAHVSVLGAAGVPEQQKQIWELERLEQAIFGPMAIQ